MMQQWYGISYSHVWYLKPKTMVFSKILSWERRREKGIEATQPKTENSENATGGNNVKY
jgi:hypothetical protein